MLQYLQIKLHIINHIICFEFIEPINCFAIFIIDSAEGDPLNNSIKLFPSSKLSVRFGSKGTLPGKDIQVRGEGGNEILD